MKKFLALTITLSLSIFAVACGDSEDHDQDAHSGEEESIEAEACEHMVDGPATAVTAGATEAGAAKTSVDD